MADQEDTSPETQGGPKGDRTWLALCTATGVAVDVTLNKYSSTLPGLAVLAIWAVPAILFVFWFMRVENTRAWVRTRFMEHPVSYILMFLILIPFGWQATATVVAKLHSPSRTSPAPTAPASVESGAASSDPRPSPTADHPIGQAAPEKSSTPVEPGRKQKKPHSTSLPPLAVPNGVTPSSLVQSNSEGGINIQQGTTGPDSPIINSPITVGNIPKAISAQDMTVLKKYFLNAESKSKIQISADQFSGAVPLPDDFYDALKGGGWTMVDAGVIHMVAFSAPGKQFHGAVVIINGEPLPEGQMIYVNASDPIFYIGNALQSLKIPRILQRNKNQPEGVIGVAFEGGFPE